jgi:NAD-dependent DNA ligase
MTTDTKINYDELVPQRLQEMSQHRLRGTIRWADYNYWVKDNSIMSDYTFDLLVREYKKRYPEDEDFLNEIGMW